MLTAFWIIAVLIGFLALTYVNASGRVWGAGIAAALLVSWLLHALPLVLNVLLTAVFIVLAIPLAIPTLRRRLISDGVLTAYRRLMPPMSQTEREAIEAGTVWWDGELFSGRPDWNKLLETPPPSLTPE
jgi:acyl-CoA dehydrogenase